LGSPRHHADGGPFAFSRSSSFGVSRDDIRHVLETGETIREHPDDNPFPKYIVLGWIEEAAETGVNADVRRYSAPTGIVSA
jgi:hypothetical protein